MFLIFAPESGLLMILLAVGFGAVWGAIFGAIGHAATRGKRDFSSVQVMEAESYDVLVEASHVAQAREMISKGGPVGRRLDFLSQEFNREVNTCCSKSNDLELTQTGLEMKNVVEQFREQVQNLE